MNKDLNKELMQKAIDKWGKESQLDMVIEECSELINAIQKRRRGKEDDYSVCEEGVDVELCLEQLKYMLDMPKSWEQTRQEKIARLERLLM